MKKGLLPETPKGYALENAILTTYDFDMDTFLSGIKNEDQRKFLVFRGDGLYQNKSGIDDSHIIKVFYPFSEGDIPEKYFHAKVALFSYVSFSGLRRFILRIGSKNLYPFNNAEIELEFKGRLGKKKQPKNEPIIKLFRYLSRFMEEQEAYERLNDIITMLECVRFSLSGPYKCDDFSFFMPEVGDSPLFFEPYEELLILSPNLSSTQLKRLLSLGKENARCFLVTEMLSAGDMIKEGILEPIYLSLPIEKYVHAKLFLIKKEGRYDLYAGSMNLTDFAVTKNDEAMVYLKGVKGIESVPEFLSRFFSLPIESVDKEIAQYDTPIGELFFGKINSIKRRLGYIDHLLRRNKYEAEEKKQAIAALLSSAMGERLKALIESEELDILPLKKEVVTKGKTRIAFSASFFDALALGYINHVLHSYDELFSQNVFLHIAGRGPRDIFKRIHQDKEFPNLYLFRTDIHAFDPSMDKEVLLERAREEFSFEPCLEAFLERYIRFNRYKIEANGPIYEDGPAQYTGLPLAGFMENLYLSDFDRVLEKKASFYVRCGDDMLLGTKTKEETASLAALAESLLKDKKLTLSQTKSYFIAKGESCEFLGWKIKNGEIDFTDKYLEELEKSMKVRAQKILKLSKKRAIRLYSVIKLVNSYIDQNDFRSSFKVITVDKGLKRIDRMIYEFIRTLASGKQSKAKYEISHEDLQACGYQTLVNSYYRFLKK